MESSRWTGVFSLGSRRHSRWLRGWPAPYQPGAPHGSTPCRRYARNRSTAVSKRKFFRRQKWDSDRVQEIEPNIQNEMNENTAAGIAPEEARRRAYLKFGNPTRVREEIWQMNSIALLENFLREGHYAWRT